MLMMELLVVCNSARFLCNANGLASPAPIRIGRMLREVLFDFHVERTHRLYRVELVDRGKRGVDAKILEVPDALLCSHRFPDRAEAARWAEMTRADLEAGYYETGD